MNDNAKPQATAPVLLGPQMLENPYPIYHMLQSNAPVYWAEPLKTWVITRHADVVSVLKDKRFSNQRPSPIGNQFHDAKYQRLFELIPRVMLRRDDPDHARLRKLIGHEFGRTRIEDYSDRIGVLVDEFLQAGLAKGEMDFLTELAIPLPITVIFEFLGLPLEDHRQVKAWCDDLSSIAIGLVGPVDRDMVDRCLESLEGFEAYLRRRIEILKIKPDGSLLSNLVQAAQAGEHLDFEEVIANFLLLLVAGNETTTALLTNGLAALLENPAQLAKLRADPALAPQAVEEFLRFDSPVQYVLRRAAEDIEIGGQVIGKDQTVMAVLAAAGRDPEVIENAEELDIARQRCPHVGFGSGAHVCLGLQLARLEARIVFDRIARLPQTITLESGTLKHGSIYNLRCYESLPIRLAS